MPNQFAKDATALYYKMRKTNKNYKFSNALKDLSLQRKKSMSKSTKNVKHMSKSKHTFVDAADETAPDALSQLNPTKSKSFTGKRNGTRRNKSRANRM